MTSSDRSSVSVTISTSPLYLTRWCVPKPSRSTSPALRAASSAASNSSAKIGYSFRKIRYSCDGTRGGARCMRPQHSDGNLVQAVSPTKTQQVGRVLSDPGLLIHVNYVGVNLRAFRADPGFDANGAGVAFGVEHGAAPTHSREDAFPYRGRVLADATAEDDGVGAAEHVEVGTDVLAYPIAEHLEREGGAVIAARLGVEEFSHVPGDPGDAEEARTFVEPSLDLLGVHVLPAREKPDERGIHVPRTCPHHQSFERGETHRGVDRAAAGDGRGRATVSELQRDQPGVPDGGGGEGSVTLDHTSVGRAVEPEAPNAVLLGHLFGDRIEGGTLRHRAVERRVEDGHHRYVRVGRLGGGQDRLERRPVVERRKLGKVFYSGDDPAVDQGGPGEVVSTMDDPVPEGFRRRETRGGQPVEDDQDRCLMVGRGGRLLGDIILRAEGQGRVLITYPLHEARGYRAGGAGHLDELELERRAPAVDGEDSQGLDLGVRDFAADDGHHDRNVPYLPGGYIVRVRFQNDHVTELAFHEGPFVVLLERQVGSIERHRKQGLLDRDRLPGTEDLAPARQAADRCADRK